MSATTKVEMNDYCQWNLTTSLASSRPIIYLSNCKDPIVDIYANYTCTTEGGNTITTHVYFKPLQSSFTAQLKCGSASSSIRAVNVQGEF